MGFGKDSLSRPMTFVIMLVVHEKCEAALCGQVFICAAHGTKHNMQYSKINRRPIDSFTETNHKPSRPICSA